MNRKPGKPPGFLLVGKLDSPRYIFLSMVDKKRLFWILVLIFFFFANLGALAYLVLNRLDHPK